MRRGLMSLSHLLPLTNVSISVRRYSWLKHCSLPFCKCMSRVVVWHRDPRLDVTFQNRGFTLCVGLFGQRINSTSTLSTEGCYCSP